MFYSGQLHVVDTLHKWRRNLNSNTLYIVSLVLMFLHMDVGLGSITSYSNIGAIYAKG